MLLVAAFDLVLLLVAGIAVVNLADPSAGRVEELDRDTRAMLAVPRLQTALQDLARAGVSVARGLSPEDPARIERDVVEIRTRMLAEAAGLRAARPDYSRAMLDFERAFDDLTVWARRLRDPAFARQPEVRRVELRRQFTSRVERLGSFLQALGDQVRERALEEARRSERTFRSGMGRVLALVLLGLVVARLLVHLILMRFLARPLDLFAAVVRRLATGDLNVDLAGGGRDDEVGLLALALGDLRLALSRKRVLEEDDRESLLRARQAESELRHQLEQQKASLEEARLAVLAATASLSRLSAATHANPVVAEPVLEPGEAGEPGGPEEAGEPGESGEPGASGEPILEDHSSVSDSPPIEDVPVEPGLPTALPAAEIRAATDPVIVPEEALPAPEQRVAEPIAEPIAEPVAEPESQPTPVVEERPVGPAVAKARPRVPRRKRSVPEAQMDLIAAAVEPEPDDELRRLVASGRLPGVDLEDAIQRTGCSREVVEGRLDEFAMLGARMVGELRAAIEQNEHEEARRLAHELADAAGELSVHELRRHAKTIELAIKFGQGSLDGMLSDLDREALRVWSGIRLRVEMGPR